MRVLSSGFRNGIPLREASHQKKNQALLVLLYYDSLPPIQVRQAPFISALPEDSGPCFQNTS